MKLLSLLAVIVLFCPLFSFAGSVNSAHAGEADLSRNMVRSLKSAENLSGRERMAAMQGYVCRLPDNRLAVLLDEIGGVRFLPVIPQHNRIGQTAHGQIKMEKFMPPQPPELQMRNLLQTPEGRMRLCREAANYFLNTGH